MFKQILILLCLPCFTSLAQAAQNEEIIETCKFEASLELTAPTQIFCDSDLYFADGLEISTNGHGLQIVVMGRVFFGTVEGLGLNITPKAATAGKVFVYARTASGHLKVDNQTETFGADIEVEYGSRYAYFENLNPGRSAEVRVLGSNGRL